MRKESLTRLVEVVHSKHNQCTCTLQLTFFQMIYVIGGSGVLHINNHKIDYCKGNLMLLTPDDEYRFEIEHATEFLLVKFSKKYINDYSLKNSNCIECVLYHAPHVSGCVLKNKPDEPIVKHIADALINEIANNDMYSEDTVLHLVNALIAITARNLTKMQPLNVKVNADNRIHTIINYIQTNIYNPDKLRRVVIAKKFGLPESYLSSYFKRQSGETLSGFIGQYKIRLIEHKLKFSDMRINEIVSEFEFSDESHLNKFFKKHKGISLTAYRKR